MEKLFFEICGEFFDKIKPNVYDDTTYYYSDFTSYIIRILVFILSDDSNTEVNTLKYEVY